MLSLRNRRAVLFDLDGTLVDSSADIAASLNHVLAADGFPPLAVGEVTRLIGDGAAILVQRAFATHGRADPADALRRFRDHYEEHCLTKTRPYLGVKDLLRRIAESRPKRSVGVVTNKPTSFSEKILAGVGLSPWIQVVVGPELVPARKPAPEHVLATLDRLGAAPADAVMVGDGTTDVLAGRDAGTATVAVLWGYRRRHELVGARPDRFVETPEELEALLLG